LDYIDMAERFRDDWENLSREPISAYALRDGTRCVFLTAPVSDTLKVLCRIVIGKRNGLTLAMWAYDPRPAILADRIVNYGVPMSDYAVTDLDEIREQIRDGRDAVEACVEALSGALVQIYQDPSRWEDSFRTIPMRSRSVGAVGGGLPGMDRRSRGVRRQR
jgi:hypothetical protein